MPFVHQEALSAFSAIRAPARSNHFTLLATATLDHDRFLLQELKHPQKGRGLRNEFDTWSHILASEELLKNESHLVNVKGTFSLPIPKTLLTPALIPKSFRATAATTASLHGRRPVLVTKLYDRGPLRDCLDKGELNSGIPLSTEASSLTVSKWQDKLLILKNVATALHNIQLHMLGQSHGGVSSQAVLLDKQGRAFLSWHRSDILKHDILDNTNNLRYYSPVVLKQLVSAIEKTGWDVNEELELTHDDMYSFGILAWEIATEELPFEQYDHPAPQQLLFTPEARFSSLSPAPLQELIQHCLTSELDQRPSWCTVLAKLNTLDPKELTELELAAIQAESVSVNEVTHASSTTTTTTTTTTTIITTTGEPQVVQDPKSEVVEMMESVLNSTFYRRELPLHLDSFTSPAGKRLFRDMILAGTGENFFRMVTSFNTQTDPAFCGVSSLSMVLNALEIDPRKQWKGVWRWYSDEQLDCCASIEEMKLKGITFNQFACLARCHAKVIVKRADRHSLQEFRRDIQMVSQSSDYQLVISFSRAALGQTGSGHFR
ncbi:hypothetical protein BG004_006518 [Podila humilis]|nr:hypothetical protein BG004_006518 [Podila humilis]